VTCDVELPRISRSWRAARSRSASSACALAPMTIRWGVGSCFTRWRSVVGRSIGDAD